MPAQKTLSAVLKAREQVTGALDSIQNSALELAAAFETADEASDALEGGLDAVERGAEAADEALGDIPSGAAQAAAAMEVAQGRADELGDELSETALEATALDGTLRGMPDGTLAGTRSVDVRAAVNDASFMAARAAIDSLPDSHTVDVRGDVDRESFSIPHLAERALSIGSVESAPDLSPDEQTVPFSTGGVSMPDLSPDERTVPIRPALDSSAASATRTLLATLTRERAVDIAPELDTDALATAQTGLSGLSAPTLSPGVAPGTQTIPFEAGAAEAPSLSPAVQSLDFETAMPDGGAIAALGADGHIAAEGLDAAQSAAVKEAAAAALAAEASDEAGDGLLSMVPGGEAAAHTLGRVRTSAAKAIPALAGTQHEIDEVGEESAKSAAEVAALGGSIRGLDSGIGSVDFGPMNVGLGLILALAPALLGLVGPLGAVAAGAVGAGGALAAMVGAGALAQGQQLVGTYQEVDGELKRITSSGQGAMVVLGDLKDRAANIFSELETPQTAQFFSGLTGAGLATLEDGVTFVDNLMGDLLGMSDRLGDAFAIQRPRFFEELEATTRATLPALESFAYWALDAIPAGLKWFRTEGLETASALADLGGSALDLAVELAEVGGVLWQTVGPALSLVFDVAAGVVNVFTDLPGPVQTFLAASAAAYPILSALAGGIAAVSAAGGVLAVVMGAISWPILAVAAAIGIVIAIMSNWETIMAIVGQAWNGLVGIIQGGANGILSFIGGMVNGAIGLINGLIDAINKIPGIDIGKIGTVDMGNLDLSGFNVENAKHTSNDANGGGDDGGSGDSGPGTGGGGGSPPSGSYGGYGGGGGGGGPSSPGGAPAAAAGGDTYDQSETTIEIYATEEQIKNKAKFKRLAREAVDEYNRERQRGSGM